ncbi:hypothetical protein BJV78DRAFT_1171753 [Lactifluus subvellereus]|nr:hypothetical protein BJV78DRAFT_1171753 [Lactifluus subvellereus]
MPPRYLTRPATKDHPRERIDKGAEPEYPLLFNATHTHTHTHPCPPPPLTRSINRWHHIINARLTDDMILATKIKRDNPDKKSTQTVKSNWEHVLRKNTDLPNDWITSREVLVGRRTRHTLPL